MAYRASDGSSHENEDQRDYYERNSLGREPSGQKSGTFGMGVNSPLDYLYLVPIATFFINWRWGVSAIIVLIIQWLLRKKVKFLFRLLLMVVLYFICLAVLTAVFPTRNTLASQRHQELNESAQSYSLNVSPANNFPMRLTELRYREDATVVLLTETQWKKSHVFTFNTPGDPDSRWHSGKNKLGTSFRVTAISGTYDSTGFKAYYDQEKKEYTGVEIFFPKEFTDNKFNMVETSVIDYSGKTIANPLVFNNVIVDK